MPLLELDKYAEHDSNGNLTIQSKVLKEKLEKLTPLIKTGKIAGKKAITISYLYKQGDVLVKIDTSLVSANDRLYLLSTVNTDQDLYAPKRTKKTLTLMQILMISILTKKATKMTRPRPSPNLLLP